MPEYINREAIIKELEEEIEAGDEFDEEDVLINEGLKIALKDIKNQSAADVQPAPKWISVHDSLPPDNKPYAVVTAINGLGVSRLMGRNKLEWTLFGEPVLYWMPLPEPPKDGDTNG